MRTKKAILASVILLFVSSFFVCRAYPGGLSTLATLGKSQATMEKALNKETKIYKSVKKGIEKGAIRKGQKQDLVQKRYGKPVVILSEKDGAEKWVYKPGYASHFDNIKIYLVFDRGKTLKGIKVLSGGN